MKRREFLKNTLLASGALTLPLTRSEIFAADTAQTLSAAYTFKKSIMWGGVGVEGSILEKCKAVKEAGFVGIQTYSNMDVQEVLDATKATGLAVADVCTRNKQTLAHPDATVRKDEIENVTHCLECAAAWGTDAILLVPGRVDENYPYDDCWNYSTESIKKLVPVAKKLKVMICVENVWNNFLLSPVEACHYLDQFKSPWVKFYFDIGNYCHIGWPEQWIKILGSDRIGRIHIKEYSKKIADGKPREGFNVKLADGDVNWTKVNAELRNCYKHSWLTTEMQTCKTLDELKDLNSRFDKILSM